MVKTTHMLPKPKKEKSKEYWANKADRLYQEIGRILSEGMCEVCGGDQQVTHHFIKKSQSTGLRYDIMNGIHLCNKCHCAIHQGKRDNVTGLIVANRGAKWMYELELKRKELVGFNYGRLWYQEQFESLQIAIKQLK